jgi:hypothetical protein
VTVPDSDIRYRWLSGFRCDQSVIVRPSPVATDLQGTVETGSSSTSPSSRRVELGLGLVVIAAPLAFLPASSAPFVDVKLVLILAGALAVWAGRVSVSSRLVLPAVGWVLTIALAGVVGVDRWWSVVGPEASATGLILLGASAFLLVAGTGVPNSVRRRIPAWLVGTSTAVAAVSILYRFWPEAVGHVVPELSFEGGTVGHPAFLAGLMATGLIAAVGLPNRAPRALVPILVVLSSALALSTKRVGWVALAVGFVVALWRTRMAWRRAFLIVGVVAATLVGWTAADTFLNPATPVSGAERFGELTTDSARARVASLGALGRAWSRRPVWDGDPETRGQHSYRQPTRPSRGRQDAVTATPTISSWSRRSRPEQWDWRYSFS